MSTADFNRSVLISIVLLSNTADFKIKGQFLEFLGKRFLEWVVTAAVPSAKELMKIMVVRASWRKAALKMFYFLTIENLGLHELRTELSHQGL